MKKRICGMIIIALSICFTQPSLPVVAVNEQVIIENENFFYDENTILTEDGREFTPFSAEMMNFFYPTNNVPEFEENENPQRYSETILSNVKLNFASLQKVLKLQAKERNFTTINEHIKITPQFIVMTQTKQKLMMKMTIDF